MKILRLILLSLLASLIAGLIIGTIIRLRLEHEPVRYFVGQTDSWALGPPPEQRGLARERLRASG